MLCDQYLALEDVEILRNICTKEIKAKLKNLFLKFALKIFFSYVSYSIILHKLTNELSFLTSTIINTL